MSTDLHPLTELMLKRMKSHPEEFEGDGYGTEVHPADAPPIGYRWNHALSVIKNNAEEADIAAINERLGKIRMDKAMEWAMDELLNGEDRRRQERERYELEKQQMYAQQMQQYSQAAQLNRQMYANNIQGLGQSNAYPSLLGGGAGATGTTTTTSANSLRGYMKGLLGK